jgi:hypothetical protein
MGTRSTLRSVSVIVWLNGTFGVGKTTTSELLVKALPKARLFDAECVGELLVPILAGVPCNDFQEWDPWRGLVVETAARVLDYVGGTLVIPQTVLVEEYWDEIAGGLGERGIPIEHFGTLVRRIETDAKSSPASGWRMGHLQAYREALPWLRGKARVVETDRLTPEQVAQTVTSLVG